MIRWLSEILDEALRRQGDSGIVVWYDAGDTLQELAEKAIPEDARLLRFDGSYLALRFELEGEDPRFEGRWIIHVPEPPPSEGWLRDWELMGERLELDLLEMLCRKAGLYASPLIRSLLRDLPDNSRRLTMGWDRLVGDKPLTEAILLDALLAIAFKMEGWEMEEAILEFLGGQCDREALEKVGLWEIWRERIKGWMGWREMPEDEETLRRRLQAGLLLSELAEVLPSLISRFSEILPSEDRLSSVAALVERWRRREDLREVYLKAAREVEREYDLGSLLTVSEELLNAETFPVIDELWRKELLRSLDPHGSNFGEKASSLLRISEERRGYFWSRSGSAPFWEPITIAVKLHQGCLQAVEEVEGITDRDGFVRRYTEDEGWWRLDLWALELAVKADDLSQEEKARIAHPAWRAYGVYLDRVNRAFAEVVSREGWEITQIGFWKGFVSKGRRTAVFLVDALRYDLARHLRDLLARDELKIALSCALAALPSVTELGMASLMPEVETGLGVKVEEGTLRVRAGKEELGGHTGRKAWLERHLGKFGKVMGMDKVEKGELSDVDLLVVFSREVDEFGTFAMELYPEGILGMVERIARSIRFLKGKGFERFVVTSDHGFLFLPPEVKPSMMEAPKAYLRKRRFTVGGEAKGCLVKRADELGLKGSELFSFPKGLAVFAVQGEVGRFLHGGLSLQENVVPVLVAEAERVAKKVSVSMDVPEPLTSRLATVTVRAEEWDLFAKPRRVVVEINGKRSEPQELNRNTRQVTLTLSWLSFDENPPSEVTIRLIDADTGEIIEERKIAVNLIV